MGLFATKDGHKQVINPGRQYWLPGFIDLEAIRKTEPYY
jgi:hypothetical protein